MLDFLSKNLVYPLYWYSRHLDVKGILGPLLQNQWRSRDELEHMQWIALKSLLNHAYKNVPYYEKAIKEAVGHPDNIKTMADFAKLPILEKKDIRNSSSTLIARNFDISKMVADSTGGSTGENIRYYEDRNELSHRFASAVRSDMWAGLQPGERYAQIWGSILDLDKESSTKRLVDRLFLRRLFISSFRLSDEDLEKAIINIRRFSPTILIGYPTPLYRLARYVNEKGVHGLHLASIISSAETLHEYQRVMIESTFGCKIFNRYGCREFGPIAAECDYHGGMHLFIDRFVVELIGHHTEDFKEYCELIITDLNKYGMPFIRYRIGDLCICATSACACGRGFPIVERIEGRSFDLILGTNGNYVAGTFWTLLFRSIPGINMFQVIQKRRDFIEVKLETEGKLTPDAKASMTVSIKKKCGEAMNIEIEEVHRIEHGRSGKNRFVISELY
jgi:phenylacetate-CoA ligase